MVGNTIESYLYGEKVGEEMLEFDLEAGYSMANKFFDIPNNNGSYALYLPEGRLIFSASEGNGYDLRELSLDGEVSRMYTDYLYDEYVDVTITTIGSLSE